MTTLSNKDLIEIGRSKTVEVIDRSDAQMSYNIINRLCDRLEKAEKCMEEIMKIDRRGDKEANKSGFQMGHNDCLDTVKSIINKQ